MTPEGTIYIHGNTQLAEDLVSKLASTPLVRVNPRKIKQLVKGPKPSETVIHFKDGSETTKSFLGHKPKTKLKGFLLQKQLSPELIIYPRQATLLPD